MPDPKSVNDIDDYLIRFPLANDGKPNNKRPEALKHAVDIRKFEIELYWKRATYFWAFIAATFTGYFALSNNSDANRWNLVLVCFLGFLFSVSWYLVNRGSKFWQNNWERHVDYLEDDIIGPLYKTAKNPTNCNVWNLMQEYPFSVSKINLLLSIVVLLIWLILLTVRVYEIINKMPTLIITCKLSDLTISIAIVIAIAVITLCLFVKCGKSKLPKLGNDSKNKLFVIREYE